MFSLPEAARRLKASLESPVPQVTACGASIDTRTLQPGDLFIALPGTQTDGHDFLVEAFERGACGALIKKSLFERTPKHFRVTSFRNLIPVEDPAAAMASLAAWHRQQSGAVCLGITGSVGKTSTKEFLHYLLNRLLPPSEVLANKGNLNNHLGVPLTLLQLNERHRFCISELGANRPGDIAFLCDILRPDAGILTKIAPAHLEGFGSMERIYETKLALFASLPQGGPAVFPAEDEELERRIKDFPVKPIRVGGDKNADCFVSDTAVEKGAVSFTFNGQYRFRFPGAADFFAGNAALALALVQALGFPLDQVPSDWNDFSLPQGRFSVKPIGNDVYGVYDGYNASPESFDAALKAFCSISREGRKILVFADMLELGTRTQELHRDLGVRIAAHKMDAVLAYGQMSKDAVKAASEAGSVGICNHFPDMEELISFLDAYLKRGDWVLFKASRGMKIEQLLERIEARRRRCAPEC